MSKYIKLEDAINKMDEWFCEPYTPTKLLSDLPTIEVSEDCIDRKRFIEVLDETAKIWAERGNDIMVRGLMTAWTIANNAPSVVPEERIEE